MNTSQDYLPRSVSDAASQLMDRQKAYGKVPDIHMDEVGSLLESCLALLFPQLAGCRVESAREVEARLIQMIGKLCYILCEVMPENCDRAQGIAVRFAQALPVIADQARPNAAACKRLLKPSAGRRGCQKTDTWGCHPRLPD